MSMELQQKQNTFSGDVLKMSMAPITVQAINMIVMPVQSRLYAPEAFGLLTLFGSLAIPFSAFSTMGYHNSILLPKSDGSAMEMFSASMMCVISITFVSFLLCFLFNIFHLSDKITELSYFIWLVPLSVFLHGLYQSTRFLNLRFQRFDNIALSRISEAMSRKVLLLSLGFLGHGTGGILILSLLIGGSIKCGILGSTIFDVYKRFVSESFSWTAILDRMKRYKKFAMYQPINELLSNAPQFLLVLFLAVVFSNKVVGYYSMALLLLSIPATLISSSIAEVYLQRGAKAKHENNHNHYLEQLLPRLFSLGFFPFFSLILFGDKLVVFVLGDGWQIAGTYASILSYGVFARFTIGPVGGLTTILERQELNTISIILKVLLSVIAIGVGWLLDSVYYILLICSIGEVLISLGVGAFILHISGLSLLKVLRIGKTYFPIGGFVVTLLMMSVLYKIEKHSNMSLLLTIVSIMIIACYYYAMLMLKDKKIQGLISLKFKGILNAVIK